MVKYIYVVTDTLPFFRPIYYLFKTERRAHNSKWIVYSGERFFAFQYFKIILSLEFHVLLWQASGVKLMENRTAVLLASVLNLLLRRTRTFDWMDLLLVRLGPDNDRRLWPRLTLRRIVGIYIIYTRLSFRHICVCYSNIYVILLAVGLTLFILLKMLVHFVLKCIAWLLFFKELRAYCTYTCIFLCSFISFLPIN